MRILCAFDSFKGCMSASEACEAAAQALAQCHPDAEVVCLPVSDGGEGMVDCLTAALGLLRVTVMVHDPLMNLIQASYAISPDRQTAYMEMAAAAGLTLVSEPLRNPMHTTTYGVGEMLLDAQRRGCRRVIMGIGGSATCDGGAGMIASLQGHLPLSLEVVVASDVQNPLFGPQGAAYVFAPQKGATPEQVVLLDQRLRDFARETVASGIADDSLADATGAGAAGGLGYALMAYLHAHLLSGIDLVLQTLDFDHQLASATYVLTGEGKSDSQTLSGKVPMGILRHAREHLVPVILLSGCIEDPSDLLDAGFHTVRAINADDPRPLSILMRPDVAKENLKLCVTHITI